MWFMNKVADFDSARSASFWSCVLGGRADFASRWIIVRGIASSWGMISELELLLLLKLLASIPLPSSSLSFVGFADLLGSVDANCSGLSTCFGASGGSIIEDVFDDAIVSS